MKFEPPALICKRHTKPMTNKKSARGGRLLCAGRPPKSDEPREQKSVNLTPRVWSFVAMMQLAHPGDSESDALERICRSHILFVP